MKQRIKRYTEKPGFYREIASWVALAVILLPFLIYAFPQAVGAKDALIVRSGSMEPAIPTGSVIVIRGVNTDNLEANDIITYQSGTDQGEPVYTTHRIVDVVEDQNGKGFVTKGDNNEDRDPEPVSPENVYGKHVTTIPYLGFVINELRSGNAILLLIIVPAVIIILNELYKISREVYGIKTEGNDRELIQTVLIAIAGMIVITSVFYFTGAASELLQNTGATIELDSTVFGGLIMAAMLLAMIILKLI